MGDKEGEQLYVAIYRLPEINRYEVVGTNVSKGLEPTAQIGEIRKKIDNCNFSRDNLEMVLKVDYSGKNLFADILTDKVQIQRIQL